MDSSHQTLSSVQPDKDVQSGAVDPAAAEPSSTGATLPTAQLANLSIGLDDGKGSTSAATNTVNTNTPTAGALSSASSSTTPSISAVTASASDNTKPFVLTQLLSCESPEFVPRLHPTSQTPTAAISFHQQALHNQQQQLASFNLLQSLYHQQPHHHPSQSAQRYSTSTSMYQQLHNQQNQQQSPSSPVVAPGTAAPPPQAAAVWNHPMSVAVAAASPNSSFDYQNSHLLFQQMKQQQQQQQAHQQHQQQQQQQQRYYQRFPNPHSNSAAQYFHYGAALSPQHHQQQQAQQQQSANQMLSGSKVQHPAIASSSSTDINVMMATLSNKKDFTPQQQIRGSNLGAAAPATGVNWLSGGANQQQQQQNYYYAAMAAGAASPNDVIAAATAAAALAGTGGVKQLSGGAAAGGKPPGAAVKNINAFRQMKFNTGNKECDARLEQTVQCINPVQFPFEPLSTATGGGEATCNLASQLRCFVIKSYSEDDVQRSIKFGVWCSTRHGNEKLNRVWLERIKLSRPAFPEIPAVVNGTGTAKLAGQEAGTPTAASSDVQSEPETHQQQKKDAEWEKQQRQKQSGEENEQEYYQRILLLFSVNGSGHFCGVAELVSGVETDCESRIWTQTKWVGRMHVRWLYVKDVQNTALRHIRLDEQNDFKPITNCRDATEVTPVVRGLDALRVIHKYQQISSIFDDYEYYENRFQTQQAQQQQQQSSSATGYYNRKPLTNHAAGPAKYAHLQAQLHTHAPNQSQHPVSHSQSYSHAHSHAQGRTNQYGQGSYVQHGGVPLHSHHSHDSPAQTHAHTHKTAETGEPEQPEYPPPITQYPLLSASSSLVTNQQHGKKHQANQNQAANAALQTDSPRQ